MSKCLALVAVESDSDRMGRIRLRRAADASGRSLGESIRDGVEKGSTVHTGGWRGYAGLERAGYVRQVTPARGGDEVTAAEFPHVHLIASLLKRWLTGTRQGGVGPKHLQLDLDECALGFNRRKSRHGGNILYRLAQQLVLHETTTHTRHKVWREPSDWSEVDSQIRNG